MLTMIVLIDQASNLDEHLYLLLLVPRLQKLGQERLRQPIQKPYQVNIKIHIKLEKEWVPMQYAPLSGEKSLWNSL